MLIDLQPREILDMPTWRRWANLIALFLLLSLVADHRLAGYLGLFALIIFWIAVYALLTRNNRMARIPLGVVPIAYCLIKITPAIEYLLLKWDLRRNERIRAFLRRADDIRMRKQGVHRRIPRGPG
jgi:hypothetical protein